MKKKEMYIQWISTLFKGNNNILFTYLCLVLSSVSSFIHFCSVSFYNCKLVFSLHSHHPYIKNPFSFVNKWIQYTTWYAEILFFLSIANLYFTSESLNNLNTLFYFLIKIPLDSIHWFSWEYVVNCLFVPLLHWWNWNNTYQFLHNKITHMLYG